MECHCGKQEKINQLVQVISSQIIAIQQLLANEQQQPSSSHALLQIIHNLQSSIQNQKIDANAIVYTSHAVVNRCDTPETDNAGESSILYPIIKVTVQSSQNTSALPSSSNDPTSDLQDSVEVGMGEFLSNILDFDEGKKKKTKPNNNNESNPKTKRASSGKGKGKRKVTAENWKRNANKKKRLRGEAYLGIKRMPVPVEGESPGTCAYKYKFLQAAPRPPRKVGPRCTKHLQKSPECISSTKNSNDKTAYQCYRVTDETRHAIFEYFWKKLDWGQRKIYISALVTVNKVQRRRSTSGNSNRSDSYKYYLRTATFEMIRVCKSFFVSTFDIGDRVVRDWVQLPSFSTSESNSTDSAITSNNNNHNHSDHDPITNDIADELEDV